MTKEKLFAAQVLDSRISSIERVLITYGKDSCNISCNLIEEDNEDLRLAIFNRAKTKLATLKSQFAKL